ncbi:MAG: D-alanine--D-alanine ligase [Saprospiraceae bacterium]|nr:D-alanine--D-alanine ligase [Saprospiraceae bacterium]
MRIGIFFGGPSREREVAFAGGRTVYDNLDKDLFEAVPIFVDSLGQFILLDWKYIYKGTIRDFYPPSDLLPEGLEGQYYIDSFPHLKEEAAGQIGRLIDPDELSDLIDFAFLALHGRYGEDGVIQSQLLHLGIPFSGSGIMACAIGMDKYAQKRIMAEAGFDMPKMDVIQRKEWLNDSHEALNRVTSKFKKRLVIRPSRQGSSIGVSILDPGDAERLKSAVDQAFFIERITGVDWHKSSHSDRQKWIQRLSDVKTGLGFPLLLNEKKVFTVSEVIDHLDDMDDRATCILKAIDSEQTVIVESFIEGREFSCIVIRNLDGRPLALPPTEIVKKGQLFDYRSKYLPGLSRKETPIDLPSAAIESIRQRCTDLYELLGFGCYARIDGFYTEDERVILNDPNTTSGMLPSSFFFHQAAEIGLNPSQFITYIIYTSLIERRSEDTLLRDYDRWMTYISEHLTSKESHEDQKLKVAIILGGYSFERHISVESGRNIFEKLSSSKKYSPTPVFLHGGPANYKFIRLPLNYLLKDNADDIKSKIDHHKVHPVIASIRKEAEDLTKLFAGGAQFEPKELELEDLGSNFDQVFIALHGRPGEDGELQAKFEKLQIPYNGSNAEVSSVTINKFDTLQLLGSHNFPVTDQWVIEKADYLYDKERWLQSVEGKFGFPLIAKPVDDGCSSAVIKVRDLDHLRHYMDIIFRENEELTDEQRDRLSLAWNEEFPKKKEVLIESLIDDEKVELFMEITCGVLTQYQNGDMEIQVFEPSEALSTGDVLSLEEKFLAGQGQNITPARLRTSDYDYDYISERVKSDLKRAVEILGIEGYARVDAFVKVSSDGRVDTIIIEINSLPGMTPATCIYHQAALEGMKPYDFIDKILTFARERQQKQLS